MNSIQKKEVKTQSTIIPFVGLRGSEPLVAPREEPQQSWSELRTERSGRMRGLEPVIQVESLTEHQMPEEGLLESKQLQFKIEKRKISFNNLVEGTEVALSKRNKNLEHDDMAILAPNPKIKRNLPNGEVKKTEIQTLNTSEHHSRVIGTPMDKRIMSNYPIVDLDAMKVAQPVRLNAKYHLDSYSELSNLLKKLFLDQLKSRDQFILSAEEMMVLAAILRKKFNEELPVANVYGLKTLFSDKIRQSKKRPEECYKFVFKHAFKNLKRLYCDMQLDHCLLDFKSGKMANFYEYYFGEASKASRVPLSYFYLPLTPDAQCNRFDSGAPKTINLSYVNLMIQSERFVADLMDYLNNKFISDYSQLIVLKIDHMVGKWNEISVSMNYSDRSLDLICDYIEFNKKSKLPWTVIEVLFAIETVRKMIDKVRCDPSLDQTM